MKRVTVVTGSRAEYGVLKPLLRLMRESSVFELRLVVAGEHLLSERGTITEVEADGYPIADTVEMVGFPDVALAHGILGFGRAFHRLEPELVYVEGDRVEALAAALAAAYSGIPVAHSGGGVVTGTIDNAARHSISQFASLHFVELDEARDRLIAYGRDPDSIHVVGALGIDAIHQMQWRSRESVLADLGMPPDSRYLLVTFHPESEHPEMAGGWMENLLKAAWSTGLELVITHPNSDPGSAAIIRMIELSEGSRVHAFRSLGSDRYLHAMRYADAVVGNSSSGLLEAPSLRVPVVNIGYRQAGRPRAGNVIQVGYGYEWIRGGLVTALRDDAWRAGLTTHVISPYGDGHTAERIMVVLERRLGE